MEEGGEVVSDGGGCAGGAGLLLVCLCFVYQDMSLVEYLSCSALDIVLLLCISSSEEKEATFRKH